MTSQKTKLLVKELGLLAKLICKMKFTADWIFLHGTLMALFSHFLLFRFKLRDFRIGLGSHVVFDAESVNIDCLEWDFWTNFRGSVDNCFFLEYHLGDRQKLLGNFQQDTRSFALKWFLKWDLWCLGVFGMIELT